MEKDEAPLQLWRLYYAFQTYEPQTVCRRIANWWQQQPMALAGSEPRFLVTYSRRRHVLQFYLDAAFETPGWEDILRDCIRACVHFYYAGASARLTYIGPRGVPTARNPLDAVLFPVDPRSSWHGGEVSHAQEKEEKEAHTALMEEAHRSLMEKRHQFRLYFTCEVSVLEANFLRLDQWWQTRGLAGAPRFLVTYTSLASNAFGLQFWLMASAETPKWQGIVRQVVRDCISLSNGDVNDVGPKGPLVDGWPLVPVLWPEGATPATTEVIKEREQPVAAENLQFRLYFTCETDNLAVASSRVERAWTHQRGPLPLATPPFIVTFHLLGMSRYRLEFWLEAGAETPEWQGVLKKVVRECGFTVEGTAGFAPQGALRPAASLPTILAFPPPLDPSDYRQPALPGAVSDQLEDGESVATAWDKATSTGGSSSSSSSSVSTARGPWLSVSDDVLAQTLRSDLLDLGIKPRPAFGETRCLRCGLEDPDVVSLPCECVTLCLDCFRFVYAEHAALAAHCPDCLKPVQSYMSLREDKEILAIGTGK